jgi:tRNA(Arg) A34 adenosine deaminase TadA
MNQYDFMRRAIHLSREMMRAGNGGPFAAVIVNNGRIVAEGFNQVTSTNDPTAHGEIVAIREACRVLNDFSLKGCDIYTSCEPCPMCMAAIYWARIDKIYFANTHQDAARIGFDDKRLYSELCKPLSERTIPTERILQDEAITVFEEWERSPGKTRY